MIDPNNLTRKAWSYKELEEFWIFSLIVAGKKSEWAARVTEKLCTELAKSPGHPQNNHFDNVIRHYLRGTLRPIMEHVRTGKYNLLQAALINSAYLYLREVTVESLECIPGCGPKTARFFLLYTQPGADVIPLDTHILAWMRDQGIDTPANTPPGGKRYNELEQQARELFDEAFPGLSRAEQDLHIWKLQSGRLEAEAA